MLISNLPLFASLFILQFVGHRVGDYLFQTDFQAQNKTKAFWPLFRHCFVYALTVALFSLIVLPPYYALIVFAITIIEHLVVDTRIPVMDWKIFLEKYLARRKDFLFSNLPTFVVIEIDQTIHMLRMLIISIIFCHVL